MGDQRCGIRLAFIAGAVVALAPLFAAAQNQTQTPHNTSTLHFDLPSNPRAFCSEKDDKAVTTKERLLALPANVIEPQKTPEGWPDLQGSWNGAIYPGSARSSLEQGVDPLDQAVQCQPLEKLDAYRVNLMIDPMKGRIPYQPWAKAKQMEFLAAQYTPQRRMDLPPEIRCVEPEGVPHSVLYHAFMDLRYIPGAVVFVSNKGTRIVPMDATPPLSQGVALFAGDSRGHWEGHTLVIETTNSREASNWFDSRGTFHSEAMRVIERLTMVSQNTMYYEATIIDPTVFTQPWKVAQTFDREKASTMVNEDKCHEEDTSAERIVRAGLRARAAGLFGYRISIDLATGKAVDPEDQKYLDESGQPVGFDFAPAVPDSALPKGFNYMYKPPDPASKGKDVSSPQ